LYLRVEKGRCCGGPNICIKELVERKKVRRGGNRKKDGDGGVGEGNLERGLLNLGG